MKLFARLVMITVLATFVASTVAHAAGSAKMAAEMITAGVEMPGFADCDACDDDAAGLLGIACDFVCNSAAAGALLEVSGDGGLFAVSSAYRIPISRDSCGLTSPPAKQPPRLTL